MFKAFSSRLYSSFFAPIIKRRGAAAGSIGLFLGMLPLVGIRMALIVFVSFVFRLNLFALLLGMGVTLLFPFLHLFSFLTAERLAGQEVPYYSSAYMKWHHLIQWTPSGKMHLAGSLLTGSALAILAFPLFLLLFNLPRVRRAQGKAHVFQDVTGARWGVIRRTGMIGLCVGLLIMGVFGSSLLSVPFLPGLHLDKEEASSRISPIADKLSESSLVQQLKEEDRNNPTYQLDFHKHHKQRPAADSNSLDHEVYGFYVNWDENSKQSLLQYGRDLTTLIPEWYHLKSDFTIDDQTDKELLPLAKGLNLKVQPLLSNYENDRWDTGAVHRLLLSPERQELLIGQLDEKIRASGESGINIDFESLLPGDQDRLTAFIHSLCTVFHAHGLQVTEDVPPDDAAFDYGALAKEADRLIVMMYDEHDESGKPGPIASDPWFGQSLDNLDIPPEKLVVSMASYGYDWLENGTEPADSLTFGDIMEMARQSNMSIYWDDKSGNPYFRYDEDGDSHIVWFLDAASFYNQLKVVRENGFRGVALWRLGSEDPGIWKLLEKPQPAPADLSAIYNPTPVHYTGEGEILRIASTSSNGSRTVRTDKDGDVDDESYDRYPTPFEIKRYGKPKSKQIVLTFDDGPSGRYTSQILDILRKYRIKASFFVVGENAEVHPDLVERIYREGHELGNHTFTHPNVADTSELRTRMELNATQRLVQEITGHSMTFFRPPYVADAEPSTPSELLPILRAQEMGYTMVGELIDPEDWAKPSAAQITQRVMDQLHEGNVILLHDAGGNRSQTVEALPAIIENLKSQGYTFTTLSGLIGKTRADTMPKVSGSDVPLMIYEKAVFNGLFHWNEVLQAIFYSAIAIGMIRVSMLMWLSWRHKRQRSLPVLDDGFQPRVSVVIAAYNEEKVICTTIQSILSSDYGNMEIVVVDDGSSDGTAQAVRERFGGMDTVRLITKPNGGKALAVNLGFLHAQGEIIVAIDADTLIASDAITLLVGHFRDETVAAVSGNVRIGNTDSLLTVWQHIEYVTGFNLERRAFDRLNCITVVPGAIGAWRKICG